GDEKAPQSSTERALAPQGKETENTEETKRKKTTAKKTEEDASLLSSQPTKKELEALKRKKTSPKEKRAELREGAKPLKEKEIATPLQKSEKKETVPTEKEEKAIEQAPPKEASLGKEHSPHEKKSVQEDKAASLHEEKETRDAVSTGKLPSPPSLFRKLTPEQVRNRQMGKGGEKITQIESFAPPPPGEGEQGGMNQNRKKDKEAFLEADNDTASIPLPTFENPLPPVTPAEAAPAYSKLSPEVYELFEKMAGVMIIQQDKGETTTTININMPESVFNGAQVVLEQYSTAPHSYNLQLVGSPAAVKVFTENLKSLENSFKQANFNFETNILNPIISQEKKAPHLIRRKGSSGGKGGGGGKKGSK
ncbi:MAG: hypothetical protein KDK60_04330, partial [Chlamydiia bacterium]|nr:hypothetical protein [Chlamydiia bacterium]